MSTKKRMALATTLGAASYIGGIGLTVSSAWLITMAAQQPPILVLSVSIVMVRFFGIFRSVARYAERVVSHEAVFQKLTSIRAALFERISLRNSLTIRDLNSSSFVKAIVDDVERAQEYQLRVTLPRYTAFISTIFSLILAIWIFPKSLIVLLPVSAVLLFLIPHIAQGRVREKSKAIESLEDKYAGEIARAQQGEKEARIYGYRKLLLEKLQNLENQIRVAERDLLESIRTFQIFTFALQGIAITGTVWVILNMRHDSEISPVQISMAIFLPLVGYEAITQWYPNLFTSGKLLRAQSQIDEIIHDLAQEAPHQSGSPQFFDVKMENVTVSWDRQFMEPVTATVSRGEVLVVRGKSGSGKSTLALALVGALPYDGSITIGEVELRDIHSLDKYISASLQRGHIFNTTLRENLKIANPQADDIELMRIISLVELDAIALDEVIGEFGRPVSGGEAKRISVARTLLTTAPIIILDEPTEHLDYDLARRLEERITAECRDKTLLVVTHSGWLKSTRSVLIERE